MDQLELPSDYETVTERMLGIEFLRRLPGLNDAGAHILSLQMGATNGQWILKYRIPRRPVRKMFEDSYVVPQVEEDVPF